MFSMFKNLVNPFEPYTQTDTPPRRLWPFLLSMAGPVKTAIWLSALFSVAVAMVELLVLNVAGGLVDRLANTPPAQVWQTHGWWLLLMAGFMLVLRPLVQSLHAWSLFVTLMGNVATVVRWRSHRHVARQSIGWFESDFAGRISNRISQTPAAVEEIAVMILEALAYAASYALGALVLVGAVSWQLMVPMALWLLAYVGLLRLAVRYITPASEAHSNARSLFTGRIVDGYTNIHLVKMSAHADHEEAYVRDAVEQVRDAQMREMWVFTWLEIALVVLNGFLVVGVIGLAVHLWVGGAASLGVIAAASALVLRLNAMTGWIMWAVVNLFKSIGVVNEGMDTITAPVDLLDAPEAQPLQVEGAEIALRGLTHRYGRATGGIDGLDLTIAPGEKIGLIGRSGAGKSTIVKLLLRFYDAEGGRIEIDGQDITQVTQDSLRRSIGMVQQDSALLHRSIRDNLLYGCPGATEAQMIAAAKQAQAHAFILDLTDSEGRSGYDALVGERGVKLSGGQRQRIALARVILKDAPILVLDEATSALDSQVEAAIQTTLAEMMQGKTVVAIAHRLSTIAQMDRIVVLDAGQIVETGSHQELLRQGGLYADLWARQSGGFMGVEHEK